MRNVIAKRIGKLAAWLIFFAIIGLVFTHFMTWISVETSVSEENVHYNFEMIKNSKNVEIQSLSEKLGFLDLSLWLVLIFGLLSYIGLTLFRWQKCPIVTNLIVTISGIAVLTCSILVLYSNIVVINSINGMSNVSVSSLLNFHPIKHTYLLLIVGIILMMGTISYTLVVVPITIRSIIGPRKEEKSVKKRNAEGDDGVFETRAFEEKKGVDLERLSSDDLPYRRTKVESWLKKEIESSEKPRKISSEESEEKKIEEPFLQEEQSKSIEEEIPEPKKHETGIKDIFPDDESFDFEDKKYDDIVDVKDLDRAVKPKMLFGKPVEKSKEPMFWDKPSEKLSKPEEKIEKPKDIPRPVEKTESFEKPLPPPIVKEKPVERKLEITEEKTVYPIVDKEEPPIKEKKPVEEKIPAKSKINVRCPSCKNIFPIEKIDGKIITKIKCPHCGREGVAK